jgi:hypothetical protein
MVRQTLKDLETLLIQSVTHARGCHSVPLRSEALSQFAEWQKVYDSKPEEITEYFHKQYPEFGKKVGAEELKYVLSGMMTAYVNFFNLEEQIEFQMHKRSKRQPY